MLNDKALCAKVQASYGLPPTVDVGGNVRCIVDHTPLDETLVIVPGTTDLEGWLRDFSSWPQDFGEIGYCHEGFGSGGRKLWEAIQKPMYRGRITFVGHSLGAAVAQVLAAYAAVEHRYPFRLVTWGTPRVPFCTNFTFAKLLREAEYRQNYHNDGDPISDVPFRPVFKTAVARTVIGKNVGGVDPMANHSIDLYASNTPAVTGPYPPG